MSYDGNEWLKSIAEYKGFVALFGDSGWIMYVLQALYYIFESFIMVLVVGFGQAFGERKFSKKNIPWGGILLALTWGLSHWLNKGMEAGITCAIVALYFGISYLLLKKNAVYSWLLFAIAYTL
jgi:hypothetical protein